MKLKPVIKKTVTMEQTKKEEPKKQRKSGKNNTLPPDSYKPMFKPTRFLVKETPSKNDPTKIVKQYLELSVKRFGDDEENAPMVYIQMYQGSDFYTGYLKGKTVYLPLEMLYDLIDNLTDLSEECDKRKIQ